MSSTQRYGMLVVGAAAICLAGTAVAANVRAKADVTCRPASDKLVYDCLIKLTNSRTGEPLTGIMLTVGADMPSMPMAHNVRPVKATPGHAAGEYHIRIALEMHGDWALQLDLSGAVHDRVMTMMRFETDGAAPAAGAPARHKH
jgi:hypothetical protein